MKKNTKTLFLCVVMVATLIIPIIGSGHANSGSGVVYTIDADYPTVE